MSAELGSQWSEVLAAQDVATIGALCALASFSRPELRTHVVDNVQFREFLELVPEVRPSARGGYCGVTEGILWIGEALQRAYRGVTEDTEVLQRPYTGATEVLLRAYRRITEGLQRCYRVYSVVTEGL